MKLYKLSLLKQLLITCIRLCKTTLKKNVMIGRFAMAYFNTSTIGFIGSICGLDVLKQVFHFKDTYSIKIFYIERL